jgi:hypothetical protein
MQERLIAIEIEKRSVEERLSLHCEQQTDFN